MQFSSTSKRMKMAGYIAAIMIGLLLGSMGAGGSMLSLPVFVYLFNLEPTIASGYSMFVVGVTSLLGVARMRAAGPLDLTAAIKFGVPIIISTFCVRMFIVPNMPLLMFSIAGVQVTGRLMLLTAFAVLLMSSSLKMLSSRDQTLEHFVGRPTYLLILAGSVVGFITGMVGVGGGFLIIPALMFLFKVPFKSAVTTSLFIIAVNCGVGFTADVALRSVMWSLLFKVTAFAIVGMIIGTSLAQNISPRHLKTAFATLNLIVGTLILLSEFRG